ncbi:MAG: hypothetical protein DVB23_000822 [Verrucomicrobia bacterium]|nr:MAG: hypothetical protein DVB23_000822 [Verrucomicrobiota bacterium]
MKLQVLACAGVFFYASITPASAFEFSKLVSPFVTAVRFVGGLLPFREAEENDKDRDEASSRTLQSAQSAQTAQEAEPIPADPDKVIGTIRFAYDDFVLIYTPIKLDLPAGTRVTTVGKDGVPRAVELSLSKERKGPFLVADVSSGEPMAGDIVVLLPKPGSGKVAQYQVLE